MLVFILIFFEVLLTCDGANILCITPQPMLTHQTALRPLWKELAKRGHNITLLTTNPMNDKNTTNLKEIDASYCYKIREKYNITRMVGNKSVGFREIADIVIRTNNECFEAQLSSPEGQNLLHNPENHFDLLFVEAQLGNMMGFSWKYNIPFIGIASLDCNVQFHVAAGNEVHPVANVDTNVPIENYRNPSFRDRIFSTMFMYIQTYLGKFVYLPQGQKLLQKYFGEDIPSFDELRRNMVMLFVTTNPLFQPPRASLPNTITFWQNLAMEEPKPLPKKLRDFISKAKLGVVYFSLGSTNDEDLLNLTVKEHILTAFNKLPSYHFIWKNKDSTQGLKSIPENVLMESSWLPQQDILRHSNTKLFITHAGINSLYETAYFGVPALAIPIFGDQLRNAGQIKNLGLGLKLNKRNLTEESLTWAIQEILENKKYMDKAKEIQKIFQDIDEPPLQKAVWWTEYVLRHKNLTYLKNPANGYPWWQYYFLDVGGLVLFITFIVLSIQIKICLFIFKEIKKIF